mgnify:CR=1 FL=1
MADDTIVQAVSRALDESPPRNFGETVDLAVNLRDLDLDDPSNRVDESIVLPSGTGQETQIVVFAEGETALRAEDVADEVLSGADLAAPRDDDDDANDLSDATHFYVAAATPMPGSAPPLTLPPISRV